MGPHIKYNPKDIFVLIMPGGEDFDFEHTAETEAEFTNGKGDD